MLVPILICAVTCLVMILGVLFVPTIKLGKLKLSSYWVVSTIGALLLVVLRQADLKGIGAALIADTAINPLKILILFISMTILSIYLDELGFFRYLASRTLRYAGTNQKKLFLYLYLTVSVLTVFTSNDIIILSFTPFICYFAKNANIDPIPYLAAEFVAANTWSMALVIGNPTNIYLATANGIDFLGYLMVMILPTLASGLAAFLLLYFIFRKRISTPIKGSAEAVTIEDRVSLTVGLIHLGVCTVILAISSYIGLEMWFIAGLSVVSLFFCAGIISLCRKKSNGAMRGCLKRAPWQLIPFVLSMFVMTIVLTEKGVTASIGAFLGDTATLFRYGFSSFFAANIINNIPMSVLFCSIMESAGSGAITKAVFATIVGSNVGAFMTPIGALAGIMWSSILNHHGLKFGYLDFLKIGFTIAIPTLCVALLVLEIIL